MDSVHIDIVATPLKSLAVGEEFQAGEIGNRTGGSVLARNPLRVKKSKRTRLHRDRQPRMEQSAGRVAGVDGYGDFASKTSCNGVLSKECGWKKDSQGKQAKGERSHLVVGILTSLAILKEICRKKREVPGLNRINRNTFRRFTFHVSRKEGVQEPEG